MAKRIYKKYGKGLNEKQYKFCEWYCMTNNRQKSAKMAGYESNALETANRLLSNIKVIECIKKLKQTLFKIDLGIVQEDVINKYISIAFADISDYAKVIKNDVKLQDSDGLDYSVVKKVKVSHGETWSASIELEDKMKALQWLSDYMMIDPTLLHKHNIDNKKIEIEQKKLKHSKLIHEDKIAIEIEKMERGIGDKDNVPTEIIIKGK